MKTMYPRCFTRLGSALRRGVACALVLTAGAWSAWAELPAGWEANFTNALARAKAKQQPVLAYFTASWCGPCKMMARTTLTNQAVIEALAHYSHVAVDIDEHPELTEKYGVRAVPTFHVLTASGDNVATTTGYQDAERFLQWLTNGLSEVQETAVRQKESAEKLAQVDQLLRQADVESQRQAATELIDLCAERDGKTTEGAAERLAALVKRDAALLLDGLDHPRLAARICVANLMRSRFGDAFDVDPWSEKATRQQGIARWRANLSKPEATAGSNP